MVNFTKKQWSTLIVIGIADFCNAICVSLQAPFYPQVAESKKCTATEYGLVFGVFEFVVFLVSPFFGRHINKIGPKRMFIAGLYTIGICAILFGTLDKIENRYYFIISSFLIRIAEAVGNAAFLTASFAIIAIEFPEHIATTFACLETFFGLGLIVGPTVGGALYQAGGYTLPFAVMGSSLCLASFFTTFVLSINLDHCDGIVSERSILTVLKIPSVFLAIISVIVTSMSIGFLQATLEPHLRDFHLTPVVVGLMFVINGGIYAITTPVFGFFCDKLLIHPKKITILGCAFVAIGFTLIGPLPIIPLKKSIGLIIGGLILHGFGMGAQLVASFSDALRTSVAHGFPDNVDTYGLISGLWTSSFALGASIGPSISGILYDIINFSNASIFVIIVHIFVGIIVFLYLCYVKPRAKYIEIRDDIHHVDKESYNSLSRLNSITESMQSGHTVINGISIEKSRPPAMNGLIACNSYFAKFGKVTDILSI
ncbi:MFS-type transporter SLC18B1-like [Diorhabda carinulata]|uniref:MFS-type transporter SLC18B1-like n=1 Tax=Diorhabda carinulata TaxID=1163345 RepID=UPI0025A29FFC|nr:MFS-type transporter SLC18B1-like [Diorhabda carinulata]